MSRSWALTHRNEYGLGLDLRTAAGADIFPPPGRRMPMRCSPTSNREPLLHWAFRMTDAARANPRIVLAESSAFGDTGPWSARMGYGPLVRATTGVTRLWTSADADDRGSSSTPPRSFPTTSPPASPRSPRWRADPSRPHRNRRPRARLAGRSRGQPARHAVRHRGRTRRGTARRRRHRAPRRLSVRGRRRVVRDLDSLRRRTARPVGRRDGTANCPPTVTTHR